MSDDTLHDSFFAEAIPYFRLLWKYLPPPLTKSHISPVSAFLSKLKPSLLASSATSSPATLLHAARPRLSRQLIHTRPPSSPPSTSHMRLPLVRHLPPKSPTPPPNKRHPKPWCTQHSQDIKEHLAARRKSRLHTWMRSRWLPFVPNPRSWSSTLPFSSYAG